MGLSRPHGIRRTLFLITAILTCSLTLARADIISGSGFSKTGDESKPDIENLTLQINIVRKRHETPLRESFSLSIRCFESPLFWFMDANEEELTYTESFQCPASDQATPCFKQVNYTKLPKTLMDNSCEASVITGGYRYDFDQGSYMSDYLPVINFPLPYPNLGDMDIIYLNLENATETTALSPIHAVSEQ